MTTLLIALTTILIIIFLFLSALFSGSEIAIFSLSRIRLRRIKERGKRNKSVKALIELKKNQDKTLTTILLCNNFVNIAATSLSTYIILKVFSSGSLSITLATIIMTLFILIFGEIIPKTFAYKRADKISLLVSRPLLFFMKFLSPIIVVFERIGRIAGRAKDKITEEDIKIVLRIGVEEGVINRHEERMVKNIFELGEKSVEDILVPKSRVVAVKSGDNVKDVLAIMLKSGFSRLPVFEGTIDRIIGIVNIKDIVKEYIKNKKSILTNIVKEPIFVPRSKLLDELLGEMRNKNIHMAIVVDDMGNFEGIVTLEDILEEIVGEIYDEIDVIDTGVKKVSKREWVVDGSIPLIDINRRIGSEFQDEEFSTLAGMIINKMGKIPRIGESVKIGKYIITIEDADKRRVKKVKIRRGK